MIRASKFIHHAKRLQNHARQTTVRAASTAGASSSSTSNTEEGGWLINLAIGAAASVSALGVGIATQSCMENKHVVQCELAHQPQQGSMQPSSWSSGMPSEEGSEDDEEGDNIKFKTIEAHELAGLEDDGGKSARAFNSALEHGLFNTYEDGADDWDEAEEEDSSNAAHTTASVTSEATATNYAVTEHFVSFSPMSQPANLQPRMSIRHTNRKAKREQSDTQDAANSLLATSDSRRQTLKEQEEDQDEPPNKEVILKRINTVRRNGLGQNQVYTKNMYFYKSSQIKELLRNKFRLFALPSSEHLGKEMASLLGTSLNCLNVGAFTDGETSVKIDEAIRGKEVFVVCTTNSTNSVMELLLTISAMRRGSAKRINAVIPYYGYCRQDRRTGMKREPIAAADIAQLLEEMGVDSVICVDLHNPLLKGFFSPTIPVDHLMPGPVAAAYFYEELFGTEGEGDSKEEGKEEEANKEPKEVPKITVVAAHENQVFRANGFRNALQKLSGSDDIRVALITNTKSSNVRNREKSGISTTLVGDVEGRKCIIVDDIISTGNTMRTAIDVVNKSGASEIYAWATHGVLHLPENDTPQQIQDMEGLKYLLISNSVSLDRELPSKIRKLSIAPLLAESVARSFHRGSILSMMKNMGGDDKSGRR